MKVWQSAVRHMFLCGMDTHDIAVHFSVPEADILKKLTLQREADRGLEPSIPRIHVCNIETPLTDAIG